MPIIYFEGVDGVGKTSTMMNAAKKLVQRDVELVLTKEPGGPKALAKEWGLTGMPYGRFYNGFRDLCVDHPDIPQVVKRALYRADSLYNWELVVKPNLSKLVLCDRSWMSDLAYGSVLTEFDMDRLYSFNEALAPRQINESYCIYLYCEESVREVRLKSNMTDHMDKLGAKVRRDIDQAYNEVFERFLPETRLKRIDTDQDLSDVVDEACEFILSVNK